MECPREQSGLGLHLREDFRMAESEFMQTHQIIVINEGNEEALSKRVRHKM